MNARKNAFKKLGHFVKSYFKYRKSVDNYGFHIKECKKVKSCDAPKKVVFLINFPESWNSVKSIYAESQKLSNVETYVLAVPQMNDENRKCPDIRDIENAAYDFFVQNNIEAIKANQNGEWFDLGSINPDYVIYTRPYNVSYPEAYKSFNVCRYSKIFYIPYAYSMLGGEMIYGVLPEEFILSTHKVFLANESRKNECIETFPCYNNRNRYEYLGFPRFDLYNSGNEERQDSRFTIAWMPRWTTNDLSERQKSSHFLSYYKDFLEYAEKNPDVKIIIRPHPKMFNHYLTTGILSQEEVDAFDERCKKSGNVFIDRDRDYINTIKNSDVLVADYTSLIAEFFMTGKPIVFCDTADGLNPEGERICSNLYYAESFSQVIEKISAIQNGNDVDFAKRKSIIRELLPENSGGIGKKILETIVNS